MSTQKNEQYPEPELNPCPICGSPEIEADTPRTVYACGSSDYDQRPNTFKQSKTCKPIGSRNRRIAPPTDTTGPVATLRGAVGVISELVRIIEKLSSTKDGKTLWECSPIKDQECYEAFLELNRIVGGAKALRTCYHLEQIPLTDTTGSGREDETPEIQRFRHYPEEYVNRQLQPDPKGEWVTYASHKAQVEALRRDGERMKEALQRVRSGLCYPDEYREVADEALRAAIDSAQRQEGRKAD